ncbi:MAG TPA: hypothetical protein GXZ26_10235 [Firmicutes bacterium]|jgi:hypothetical protein|nr:hypothetical protein [Bacillota bacterium]
MSGKEDVLAYYQELEKCYDRLAQVLAAGEAADPGAIEELAAESERIIAALAGMAPPEGEPGEIIARLTLLQEKAGSLLTQLQGELEKTAEARSLVKKGRQAVSAYYSAPQKTRYKEGKFIDRKK